MMKKATIKRRIVFRESTLEKLYAAYEALAAGGVQSYMIDDRQLTRLDLKALADEIRKLEDELDELEAQLAGGASRKAVGVIPMNW